MKTWEVIKALTENPRLKFKSETCGAKGIIYVLNGAIYCSSGTLMFMSQQNSNAEWEQVQEPVDFMTAAKALSENKSVYCVKGNSTYHYKTVGAFCDTGYGPIWLEQILEGKWYIQED